MKTFRFLACIFFSAAFFSCQTDVLFSERQALPDMGWSKDKTVSFDVAVADTLQPYDVLLFVRNTEKYPNQNLWLFIEETASDKTVVRDTVQCFLVDNQGKWTGTGLGSLYYVSVFYKKQVLFRKSGVYHYDISHGMRCDVLEGLREVGIKVQQSKID